MSHAREMPALAIPLALFGAAAAYLSVAFLALPFVAHAPAQLGAPASALAGVIGAALGWSLGRVRVPPEDDVAAFHRAPGEPWFWARLVVGVVAGGAVTGALVGSLESYGNMIAGAQEGAVAGVAFLPLALLVVAAARRARRARLGSLVAATDVREIWALLAVGIALASSPVAVAWTSFLTGDRDAPIALAIATAVAIAIPFVVLASDLRAHRAFARLRSSEALEPDVDGAAKPEGARELDLGLGDDRNVEIARRGAYRARDQAKLFVLGDLDEVERALRRAVRRDVGFVVFALLALAAHACAWSDRASIAYDEHECETFSMQHCASAFQTLARQGPVDVVEHAATARRACDFGLAPACSALAGALLDRGEISAELGRYVFAGCKAGDFPLCERYARAALAALGRDERMTSGRMDVVAEAMETACHGGSAPACKDAPILRAAADDFAGQYFALACFRDPKRCEGDLGHDKRSVAFNERACEAGHAYSCFLAAATFARDHLGFPGDLGRAQRLYARACEGGIGYACCEAASLTPDATTAESLRSRAAAAGYGERCPTLLGAR